MSRLPFDASKMAGFRAEGEPDPARRSPERSPITVSQLALLINRALRDQLATGLKVVGEIGQFRERTHWYFDVKDAGALISCVMFASSARRAGFVPRVGQQVLLTGRVEFYDKGGRTQFMVDRIEPIGAGALDLAFRRLCEELRALGWFEEGRKRALPLLPRRVAIVTSRSAAALQDVLDTARRRAPGVPIGLVDVRVQGEGAAEQVAAAVRGLSAAHKRLGIDVVLVTRGGGSMEDLWAFNERVVAEAIVACPIPVVAAIGHETDTTIAELVADVRGATPTQAAMRVFPDSEALRRQLRSMAARLTVQASRQVSIDRERLRGLTRHPLLADPQASIDRGRERLTAEVRRLVSGLNADLHHRRARLDRLGARLERHRPARVYAGREARLQLAVARIESAMAVRLARADTGPVGERLRSAVHSLLERRNGALQSTARGLDLVGPHGVLSRGYSMTLRPDGRAVRSTADVSPGLTVTTRLADGAFDSRVVGAGTPRSGLGGVSTRGARTAAASGRARRAVHNPDQMDLFGPAR